MAKVISFGSMKGGVGKTTCTVMAANALSSSPFSFDVTVLDCDPQQSIIESRKLDSTGWNEALPYQIETCNFLTFQKNANKYDKTNDFLFLDVAGALDVNLPLQSQEITKYLQYIDFLFIPFVRGNYNLESTMKYLQFVLSVRAKRKNTNRPLQVIGFVNRMREGSRNNSFLSSEISNIKEMFNVPFMRNNLKDYVLFEDTNTLESYYNEDAKANDYINFTLWLRDFHKTVTK